MDEAFFTLSESALIVLKSCDHMVKTVNRKHHLLYHFYLFCKILSKTAPILFLKHANWIEVGLNITSLETLNITFIENSIRNTQRRRGWIKLPFNAIFVHSTVLPPAIIRSRTQFQTKFLNLRKIWPGCRLYFELFSKVTSIFYYIVIDTLLC